MTLPATYPKTEPLLAITNDDKLTEGIRDKIQKIIETKPKKLMAEGQAMIMEIINDCLAALDDTTVEFARKAESILELGDLAETGPSFDFPIGDFVAPTQLAWQVAKESRKACGAHDELSRELTSLYLVLQRLAAEVSRPDSILSRRDDRLDRLVELTQLSTDCKKALEVLDSTLKKYNSLSEEKGNVKKLWKKAKFGNGDMRTWQT